MLSEKEKYYIKMSVIAAITKEKVEDARAEGEKLGEVRGKAEGEQTNAEGDCRKYAGERNGNITGFRVDRII